MSGKELTLEEQFELMNAEYQKNLMSNNSVEIINNLNLSKSKMVLEKSEEILPSTKNEEEFVNDTDDLVYEDDLDYNDSYNMIEAYHKAKKKAELMKNRNKTVAKNENLDPEYLEFLKYKESINKKPAPRKNTNISEDSFIDKSRNLMSNFKNNLKESEEKPVLLEDVVSNLSIEEIKNSKLPDFLKEKIIKEKFNNSEPKIQKEPKKVVISENHNLGSPSELEDFIVKIFNREMDKKMLEIKKMVATVIHKVVNNK